MSEKKLEDLCVWYKSQSIHNSSPWYERCKNICNGLGYMKLLENIDGVIKCPKYQKRKTLSERLMKGT